MLLQNGYLEIKLLYKTQKEDFITLLASSSVFVLSSSTGNQKKLHTPEEVFAPFLCIPMCHLTDFPNPGMLLAGPHLTRHKQTV